MNICLLGGFEVLDGQGARITGITRKVTLVLAALAVAGPRGLRREFIAELVWQKRQEEQARASLRQALSAIRKLLSTQNALSLETDSTYVRLQGPAECIDCRHFEQLVARADQEAFQDAARLYRGEILADFVFDHGLDSHFGAIREHYKRLAVTLLEEMSHESASLARCEKLARCLLETDPSLEEVHRALIRVYMAARKQNAARRQFEACKTILARELEVAPEPATAALLGTEEAPPAKADVKPDDAATRRPGDDPRSTAPWPPLSAPEVRPRNAHPWVVVMPFRQLGKEDDGFLAECITEDITSALSRVRDFFVIARQSAVAYANRAVDPRQIRQDLDVHYVVQGSIRRSGDRTRINVELLDAERGKHLWSERYDIDEAGSFQVQDQIVSQVVGALSPSIRASEIERACQRTTDIPGAYHLVLRAYPHFWAHEKAENEKALALLKQATEHDPDYALAIALKGWCHAQNAVYLWSTTPTEDRSLAMACADQAARLSRINEHGSTLVAIGATYSMTSADRGLAWSFIERALANDPNNAWGWMRAGWLQAMYHQPRESLESLSQAEKLSPYDPFLFNIYFGQALAWASLHDLERAIELMHKGLAQAPGVTWAYRMLASFYASAGDQEKAAVTLEKFLKYYPDITIRRLRESLPPSLVENNAAYFEGLRQAGFPDG